MRACLLALGMLLFGFVEGATQQRIAVLQEPGTPVVATEFLLAVGPMDEDAGEAGLAYLAARSIAVPVSAALDSVGASIGIAPAKDGLAFSIIATPDSWEAATEIAARAILRDAPDSAAVVRERRAIVAELTGRSANPADAATREIERAFFGRNHPWGRPTVGTPESIGALGFADVSRFLRSNFTPDRVVVAVAGPVDGDDVREHIRRLIGTTALAETQTVRRRPAEDLVRTDYNSITTWVSASFPFADDADIEAVRFVAYLAARELSFSPLQRSVFNVSNEVTPRIGEAEMRLHLVIPPEEADEWAERVVEVTRELGTRTFLTDLFEGHLRRYRGERVMRMFAPEDRAREAARQLLVAGEYRGLLPELEEMTPARVRAAARSLGEPTMVLLGPILEN